MPAIIQPYILLHQGLLFIRGKTIDHSVITNTLWFIFQGHMLCSNKEESARWDSSGTTDKSNQDADCWVSIWSSQHSVCVKSVMIMRILMWSTDGSNILQQFVCQYFQSYFASKVCLYMYSCSIFYLVFDKYAFLIIRLMWFCANTNLVLKTMFLCFLNTCVFCT